MCYTIYRRVIKSKLCVWINAVFIHYLPFRARV